ncbi:hypothetical protein A3D11_03910 [Candidatus Peribacteria bacterium RIFCSPHIGHO2_02_FULL_49_16]|nr:MAG: hypothetical protein A3D11_03910 [Candidatus Peribacteria bacterium RIFCSPHIGHO2_02_FULL_49_16]
MFLGLCVGLEILLQRAPNTWSKGVMSILLALSILMMLGNRFWVFMKMNSTLEYVIGTSSATVVREKSIPYYDNISEMIVQLHQANPSRPYVYRVGTFIPYFIPRNLEIIAATDNQLDLFTCLHQENDNQLTLERLRKLGFNSMVFDTNTATIESDKNGPLHTKVNAFVGFLNDKSLGMKVVVNDMEDGIAFVILP